MRVETWVPDFSNFTLPTFEDAKSHLFAETKKAWGWERAIQVANPCDYRGPGILYYSKVRSNQNDDMGLFTQCEDYTAHADFHSNGGLTVAMDAMDSRIRGPRAILQVKPLYGCRNVILREGGRSIAFHAKEGKLFNVEQSSLLYLNELVYWSASARRTMWVGEQKTLTFRDNPRTVEEYLDEMISHGFTPVSDEDPTKFCVFV